MRIVSVAYLALLADPPAPSAGTDAAEARFWPLSELDDDRTRLAFDHAQIIDDAVERVRAKLEYTSLATVLLPERFTIERPAAGLRERLGRHPAPGQLPPQGARDPGLRRGDRRAQPDRSRLRRAVRPRHDHTTAPGAAAAGPTQS